MSVPVTLLFGVYVAMPLVILTVPLLAGNTMAAEATTRSFSASLSFATKLKFTGVSSAVVALSSMATGASATGVTVSVTVCTADNAPALSRTWKVKLSPWFSLPSC